MINLYLIRGLPGSGKSTFAETLMEQMNGLHYETDMFFAKLGKFDSLLLKEAHIWCLAQTRIGLILKKDVIVSNTFTQRWEMESYYQLAEEIGLNKVRVTELVAIGSFGNIHGVPEEHVQKMKRRFEYEPRKVLATKRMKKDISPP